jgi:N-acetylmuramic acid 6-phosphate etherase
MKTEKQPPKKFWIDTMTISKATRVMLDNQEESIFAIKKELPKINSVISIIYKKLKKNPSSRLIYAGAGTSARIALQDAAELYPTFGWPKHRIDFMIAGGIEAIISSKEGAEDDVLTPKILAEKLNLSKSDILIGVAASGNTPFTKACLMEASKRNLLTIAISNNQKGSILKQADYNIILDTGYEIIAGSTRLKAATAQKICLNIISSMIMTKLGFVKNGLMTHFIAGNEKLKERKRNILKLL